MAKDAEGERGRGGEKGKGKRTQDIGVCIRDCYDLKKRGLEMTEQEKIQIPLTPFLKKRGGLKS